MPYFERVGRTTYRPTEQVGGAWDPAEQHVAPALGLLAHAVETDRDQRRDDGLVLSRLSFDILGVLPLEDVTIEVRVVRPGRTIELVEAVLAHAGRPAVLLRAWLMSTGDTAGIVGTDLEALPAPDDVAPWDPTTVWPGGFIASLELRRTLEHPGRGRFWARTPVPLLDEPVSRLAGVVGLLDIANGMTVRAEPTAAFFPNVDLTAHLFRTPGEGWLGFDNQVTFGPGGRGLTQAVLHDEAGPVGTVAQVLTLRLPPA